MVNTAAAATANSRMSRSWARNSLRARVPATVCTSSGKAPLKRSRAPALASSHESPQARAPLNTATVIRLMTKAKTIGPPSQGTGGADYRSPPQGHLSEPDNVKLSYVERRTASEDAVA